jgi:hypothetical protein
VWRLSKRSAIAVLAIVLAGGVIALVTAFLLEWRPLYNLLVPLPTASEIEKLKADARTELEALEAYRQRHGRYPDTLAAAGASPQATRFGDAWYQRFRDGQFCLYAIGSIKENGFSLSWTSLDGGWRFDTQ